MKNERGITLIALIITVIVLLILAGVAISIAINGGDIFGKASTARAEWNIAVEKENSAIQDVWDYVEGRNPATPTNQEPEEDYYGGLATAEEIERSKSIFSYEILTSPSSAKIDGAYELGEIADTSDGIKLADNTPRGTAKITGINWTSIIPGKDPEWLPATDFTDEEIEIYANAVKKLVIPVEVRLDDEANLVKTGGNLYTIVSFDIDERTNIYQNHYSQFEDGHVEKVEHICIPMARGSYYGNRDDETAETYLIIPSTLKEIDGSITARNHILFAPNSQLTSITGFDAVRHLKEIVIPSGVTEIGDLAFYCCTSLRQVFIPKSVERIGQYAFYDEGDFTWTVAEETEPIERNWQTYIEDCGTYHVTFYYEGTQSEWYQKHLGSNAWNCKMYNPRIENDPLDRDDNVYLKIHSINESIFATVKFNQTVETMHADTDYIKYGDRFDYSSEFDYPGESEE